MERVRQTFDCWMIQVIQSFYPGAMTGIRPNAAESVFTEILQTTACPSCSELIENLPVHDGFRIIQV